MGVIREERYSASGGGELTRASKGDSRSEFERDRDRILYSEYFHRLAGVTQVASAVDGGIFHNRLTHSLKVAQVARRLCERLLREQPELQPNLNADVVEAAALAHDLGHPPFGHVAEYQLAKIANDLKLRDGFEGNAQTFRILVRLSVHRGENYGLDLTRATLNATLKYPWFRAPEGSSLYKKRKKFSAYDSDKSFFEFARLGTADNQPSLEASVMDWADSVTYSVHDLEDFTRAGLIPVEKIVRNRHYRQAFLDRWQKQEPQSLAQQHFQISKNIDPIEKLLEYCVSDEAEPGSRGDLALIERYRSMAITRFLGGLRVNEAGTGIEMDQPELEFQLKFMHQLVRDYVILSPRMALQQAGQIRIIEKLTHFFHRAIEEGRCDRLPLRFKQDADVIEAPEDKARLAIDVVASLSEAEAVAIYRRIMGQHAGSLLDPTH